jgi:hypothetical protein
VAVHEDIHEGVVDAAVDAARVDHAARSIL